MFPALGGTFLSAEPQGTSKSTLFLFHDCSMLSIYFIYYLLMTLLDVCFFALAFLGLVSESGGYSLVVVRDLIIALASVVAEFGLLVTPAQELWHVGLVVGTPALERELQE